MKRTAVWKIAACVAVPLIAGGVVFAILSAGRDNRRELTPDETDKSVAAGTTPKQIPLGDLYDPDEPEQIYNADWEKLREIEQFAISPDRRYLLTCLRNRESKKNGRPEHALVMWDMSTNKEVRRLQEPLAINKCLISPDNILAIADVASTQEYRCWALRSGRVVRHFKSGKGWYAQGFQLSANAKWIAIPGNANFRIVALARGDTLKLSPENESLYFSIALHPAKPFAVTSRIVKGVRGGPRQQQLVVYVTGPAPRHGWRKHRIVSPPHAAVYGLEYSADGQSVVAHSTGPDGGFVVFDSKVWVKRAFFPMPCGRRHKLQTFSPHGKYIVFVPDESERSRARVIDVDNKTISLIGGESCRAIQFVDKEVVALAALGRPLRFYNVRTGKVVPPPKPRPGSKESSQDAIAKLPPEKRLPAHRKLGQYREAVLVGPPLIKARTKQLDAGDPATMKLARVLAESWRGRGGFRQAVTLYRRLIAISEPRIAEEDVTFPDDTDNLARTLVQFGKPKVALATLRRSLAERRARFGKDHLAVADAELRLGDWLLKLHDPAAAAEHLERAVRIFRTRKQTPPDLLAKALMLAGQAHADGHAFDRALPRLREAETILLKAHPLPPRGPAPSECTRIAEVQVRLAQAYFAAGEWKLSSKYLKLMDVTFHRVPAVDNPSSLYFLQQFARLHTELGKSNESDAIARRAVQIARRLYGMGDIVIADFRLLMARTHLKSGFQKLARQYLDEGLKSYRKIFGDDYPRKPEIALLHGRIEHANSRHDEAIKLIKQARSSAAENTATGRDVKIASSLFLANRAMSKSEFAQGLREFEQAIRDMRGGLKRVLPILPDGMKASYSRGLAKIVNEPLSCIADIERLRERYGTVDNATSQLAAERSAEWVLNTKGLAGEMLASRSSMMRGNIDTAAKGVLKNLQAVRAQLSRLSAGSLLQGAIGPRADRVRELLADEAKLSAEAGRRLAGKPLFPEWVSLDAVRKRIAADTVVVEFARYLHTDEKNHRHYGWKLDTPRGFKRGAGMKPLPLPVGEFYAAWIIPPAGKGNVTYVRLGKASEIDAAINALRVHNASGVKSGAAVSREMHRAVDALSTLLLAKLEPALKPYKRWIVSPDSALWMVPFACLRDNRDRYLIQSREIACVTSSRELLAESRAGKSKVAAIFASPDYNLGVVNAKPNVGMTLLPETATEAKAVAPSLEKYTGEKPKVFLQANATEGQVKSIVRPRVLLLSTHGYFVPEKQVKNPMLRTGLAFAGANRLYLAKSKGDASNEKPTPGDDGLLTALEVTSMDLTGTELVVLSACDTGRGDVFRAEGVAGLRQAFHLAGAKSVVASLWSVRDRSNSDLVAEFFRQLAAGKRKTEALRLAQLKVMRSNGKDGDPVHPYRWAAFMISGVAQ